MLDTAKKSNRIIWLALILLATLAVYSRTLNYGLVNWDEPLSGVRDYREAPGLEGLGDLLKPRISGTYQPVRAVATALLAQYGAKANWVPYHAVSILFYLGTVVFIYLLALVLIRKSAPDAEKTHGVSAALLAAALFALHPSHAEAVAWVTGQKDTFVAFFYLGSLYFYIRHERPGTTDYIMCLVMFALALGSKPSAVSLPLVLAAYDFTLRSSPGNRRALGRLWPGYLPFFVPAVAAVVFFVFTTARVGAILPGLGQVTTRFVKMAASVGFSAAKLVLPVNLCLRYPGFEMDVANLSLYMHVLIGLALIAWTIYAVRRGRREAFLLSWFVLALLPNSNLIRINIERADRYYYLSSAAVAILAGWGALELYNRLSRVRRAMVKRGLLAAVILLGVGSWLQAGYWGSPLKAWTRVFELYPDMPIARLGVASSYLRSGNFDESLRYYRPMLEGAAPNTEAIKGAIFISERRNDRDKALELARLGHMLAPDEEDFMASMTRYHVEAGDTAAAALVVGEWLERHPESYEALIEQGNLLWRRGQNDAAEQVFRRVIADYSNYPEVYSALARIKQEMGDYTQAEELLLKGLATGRQSGVLRQQMAGIFEKTGRAEEALEIYSRYEMPDLSMTGLEFMGAHYYSRGDYQRSLEYFQQMARRDSNLPRAYNNSAVVLEDMGRPAESDSLYNLAISLDSSYVDAWFNRGNLAFTRGSLDLARQCYLRADSLAGGSDLAVLDALVRVQAAAGDTAAARRTYERAKSSGGGSR